MKLVKQVPGLLLALAMVVFGFNKLVPFIPEPDPSQFPPKMAAFFAGMIGSGYFIPFLGLMEMLGGLLIFTRRWEALGALILAPITINIVVFHLFTSPEGITIGLITFVCNVVVLFQHKPKFEQVLNGGR